MWSGLLLGQAGGRDAQDRRTPPGQLLPASGKAVCGCGVLMLAVGGREGTGGSLMGVLRPRVEEGGLCGGGVWQATASRLHVVLIGFH